MRGVSVIAVALLVAATGCQRKDDLPARPPFTMSVPADVPDQMTLVDKDGSTQEGNGKELWAGGYRAGWKRCVLDYEHGNLDLEAEQVEAPPLGHYGIV